MVNKVSVLYRSMTGHSKKIAKAIAFGLGVTAYDVKKKPQLEKVDQKWDKYVAS